jgi:hypothetical protein
VQSIVGTSRDALMWSVALATAAAMIVGVLIFPRANWQRVALVLWGLAVMAAVAPLVANTLAGRMSTGNLIDIAGTALGGGLAFYAIGTTARARKINRVAGRTE